jgi:2-oxoglutarate decarboxylase
VSDKTTNFSEFIKESFGSNATYVEGLLERYKTDPKLVDESWQAYFGDLLSGGSPTAESSTVRIEPAQPVAETPVQPKPPVAVPLFADTESRPITGAAKKIVENMEQSLTVPTATSFRTIPVKILEENRRIINEHLAAQGKGKV